MNWAARLYLGPRHVVIRRLGAAYAPRGRRKIPSSSRISARLGAKSEEARLSFIYTVDVVPERGCAPCWRR